MFNDGPSLSIGSLVSSAIRNKRILTCLAPDDEAEAFYRSALLGIFPASTPMSTIYGHIQLRSAIVRRAVKGSSRGHLINGLYLTGKDGLQLIRRKWPERLW